MPCLELVCANSAEDLLTSNQSQMIGTSAISLPTAPISLTSSQAQVTLQPQEPYATPRHSSTSPLDQESVVRDVTTAQSEVSSTDIPTLAAVAIPVDHLTTNDASQTKVSITTSPLANDISRRSTSSSTGIINEINGLVENGGLLVQALSVQSPPKSAMSSVTTLQSSTTTTGLSTQTSNDKTVLAYDTSASIPSPAISIPSHLISSTQTIMANSNSKSQYFLSPIHTLSLDPSAILGSGISTTSAPLFQTSASELALLFGSSTSLFPHASALTTRSQEPAPLTISGQIITADSQGQYLIDGHTLTRDGAITVSGTTVSLSPKASNFVNGTSTGALSPSVTAKGGSSGPNGAGVQQFRGEALGARDGLWGSSMMSLVSFVVLLWL